MRIIVTGGAGFIGSHLVDKLIEKGHKVAIVDNLSIGRKENINPKAKFYEMDIIDQKIERVFQKERPEIVFHFAAQINVRKSVKNPIFDAKINILGSLNILENCRKNKVKKIIFASSGGAIYGEAKIIPTPEDYLTDPVSPYGITKLAVEKYLNYYYDIFNLPFVSLRFANVYGPRQNSEGEAGVIAIFCAKMLSKKQSVINGTGKQTRDFIFVNDVVEAGILVAKGGETGIFNVGTGKETNINSIFRKLKKLTGADCEKKYSLRKQGEQKRSCLFCRKAENVFGWQPKYNLDRGLEETVKWFKNEIK